MTATSQISVGWIDLFDDNMENIVDTYQIQIKSIDDMYRISETVQSPTNVNPVVTPNNSLLRQSILNTFKALNK